MTVIFYNHEKKQWFHQDKNRSYMFGYQHRLRFANDAPSFSLPVKERNGKIGPFVGIMISESSIPALLKRKNNMSNSSPIRCKKREASASCSRSAPSRNDPSKDMYSLMSSNGGCLLLLRFPTLFTTASKAEQTKNKIVSANHCAFRPSPHPVF